MKNILFIAFALLLSVSAYAAPPFVYLWGGGPTFTIASGCGTPGSLTGGATTGRFTTGQIACAPVINLPTAPHGWYCTANDITNTVDLFVQTATATNSCTLSATTTAGDTVIFHAEGY